MMLNQRDERTSRRLFRIGGAAAIGATVASVLCFGATMMFGAVQVAIGDTVLKPLLDSGVVFGTIGFFGFGLVAVAGAFIGAVSSMWLLLEHAMRKK